MVQRKRLELTGLLPLPPQDSVSTIPPPLRDKDLYEKAF